MADRSFPGTLDSLAAIRDFVAEAATAAGLDRKATYRLCLAVDEVATNVVLHGYDEAGRTGPLDVAVEVDAQAITVRLEDDAAPFDPSEHATPSKEDLAKPLEERPIGGLGLMLAAEGVDELRYERVRGRNRNVFVVRRAAGA
jgi:anti-sigma regulatory factor (Ser/Thr protein kinase)